MIISACYLRGSASRALSQYVSPIARNPAWARQMLPDGLLRLIMSLPVPACCGYNAGHKDDKAVSQPRGVPGRSGFAEPAPPAGREGPWGMLAARTVRVGMCGLPHGDARPADDRVRAEVGASDTVGVGVMRPARPAIMDLHGHLWFRPAPARRLGW